MISPDLVSTTPHFDPGKPLGTGVVIHSTRSGISMFPPEFQATLNWFKNPESKVSSHWVIARDGRKCRVLGDDNRAWHAGRTINNSHWGIELEQGHERDGFTPEQIAALVDVCAGYVSDYGVAPVRALSGFVGHQDTPQGVATGKSDPGALFPWDFFIEALRIETNRLAPVPAPSELDQLRTAANLGHFVTHGWNKQDLAPWQKRVIEHWYKETR